MIPFHEAEPNSCRAPASGDPGPDMLICGEPKLPIGSYCAACRSLFYVQPTEKAIRAIERYARFKLFYSKAR